MTVAKMEVEAFTTHALLSAGREAFAKRFGPGTQGALSLGDGQSDDAGAHPSLQRVLVWYEPGHPSNGPDFKLAEGVTRRH